MLLVLVVLGLMLFSVRTALVVAATIPFSLLFAFICLDLRQIPANLLSIGAIDFGIIVDGAVVMVENIFRELAQREGQTFDPISVKHFHEKLQAEHGIELSYPWVQLGLQGAGLVEP